MIPQAGIERHKRFRGKVTKAEMKGDRGFTWWSPTSSAASIQNPATPSSAAGWAPTRGADVALVGIPASSMWRTAKRIGVFGPRYFGFDFDYRPIEEIPRDRPKFGNK